MIYHGISVKRTMFTLEELPSEVEGILDIGIIGAGPAGLTAAIYSARKGLKTAIVSKDIGGQVAWTLDIENYLGYQFITGRELTAKFIEQMRQFPVPIVTDEVTRIAPEGDLFTMSTAGGRTLAARTVIVATGKRPRELGLPNERGLIGHGVSYCATCDAPLFRGKTVAVCGGGNSAVQASVELARVGERVYNVSRSPWRADAATADKADKQPNLEKRIGYDVTEIVGDRVVEGLRIRNRKTGAEEELKVQGVFVEIGLDPNSEFVKGLLPLNEFNEIIVDPVCKTSVPGLYAAGDVTTVHEKQIVVAAGEGAKAALSAYEYLFSKG